MTTLWAAICVIVFLLVFFFAWALCKVASDADKRMGMDDPEGER